MNNYIKVNFIKGDKKVTVESPKLGNINVLKNIKLYDYKDAWGEWHTEWGEIFNDRLIGISQYTGSSTNGFNVYMIKMKDTNFGVFLKIAGYRPWITTEVAEKLIEEFGGEQTCYGTLPLIYVEVVD